MNHQKSKLKRQLRRRNHVRSGVTGTPERASSTGWRPSTISRLVLSSTTGRTWPRTWATSASAAVTSISASARAVATAGPASASAASWRPAPIWTRAAVNRRRASAIGAARPAGGGAAARPEDEDFSYTYLPGAKHKYELPIDRPEESKDWRY
ncbi:MAG: hypothetical protein ABR611_15865, partial [Chthoniobacterales bacterium]